MNRTKIDYGIDLGTTNSAIAVAERGVVQVIKSTKTMKDTTPSCVDFNKKGQVRVGDAALHTYHKNMVDVFRGRLSKDEFSTFIEFKRTMGTDKKYGGVQLEQPYSSEALSAEVLKQLQSYIAEENISAAVVTIPALFRQNQVDATQRAAELAGLKCCKLLQEPIAASLAYGVTSEEMEGFWVVFDFGGGTFDTALMKVDEGIMKVVDTAGDNHLGGKDLDSAIVDQLLVPWIRANYNVADVLADPERSQQLRDALKSTAEHFKIALSSQKKEQVYSDDPMGEDDDGEAIELDLEVSLDEFEMAVKPIFARAIQIAKDLITRNGLGVGDIRAMLLVGGPTYSQTLRSMLREEFGQIVDTSIDPMTAVAWGAALFATTQSIPDELLIRDTAKVQLTLKYPETTVETEESCGIRIDRAKSETSVPDVVNVELVRSDGGWSSARTRVEDADIIDIVLVPGRPNTFEVNVTDNAGNSLVCEPESFTVIQGLKVARATLPRSICIESIQTVKGVPKLAKLEGLQKNSSLPARGRGVFKTQKPLRPGNDTDILMIPIIEGEPGERAAYNELVGVVNITGEDIPEFLPEESEVELELRVDTSRLVTLSVFFPSIDETFEWEVKETHHSEQKEYIEAELKQEIMRAQHACHMISHGDAGEITNGLKDLINKLVDRSDYETKLQVRERLNELLKKLDRLEAEAAWPEAEAELDGAMSALIEINERVGGPEMQQVIAGVQNRVEDVRRREDKSLAGTLIQEIRAYEFDLLRSQIGFWIGYVKHFDDDFEAQEWTDPMTARKLIDQAKHIVATSPSREKLEVIVIRLFGLLPGKDMPMGSPDDRSLLRGG